MPVQAHSYSRTAEHLPRFGPSARMHGSLVPSFKVSFKINITVSSGYTQRLCGSRAHGSFVIANIRNKLAS